MKKLTYYPPFHFVVFLIIGIISQYYFSIWKLDTFILISILISLIVFLYFLRNLRVLFTITTLLLFFGIGLSSVYFQDFRNHKNYFKSFSHENSSYTLKVTKALKSSNKYDKYFTEIIEVDNNKSCGKALLYIDKNHSKNNLNVDDELTTQTQILAYSNPNNPHQFNYGNYLSKNRIYHSIFINTNDNFILNEDSSKTIIGIASMFRNRIKESLSILNFGEEELSVIYALILGDRNEISNDIKQNYVNAGAIHMLAISGLHVGIVLLILSKILSLFERIKKTKNLALVISIFLLWCFAFFTGLSASVVRATTMFSFILLGKIFQKGNIPEHSLISSMFFILLIKPLLIFDVGFQLSYLAVFGIIWINPKISKLFIVKNYFLKKFWQILTVSISAQLGVLPLSLFYFHQFPSLFFMSNLIILPFLGFLLVFGFLIIILNLINILPEIFIIIYKNCIQLMNTIIGWVAHQETFLFQKISLSLFGMLSLYLVLIATCQVFFKKSIKQLIYFFTAIILLQCIFIYEKQNQLKKEELIVFHHNKASILGIRKGKKIFVNNRESKIEFNPITSYEIGENVQVTFDSLNKSVYNFKNKTIVLLDSSNIYNINKLEHPIVILQNNPKINLERLITTLKPTQIVADGTNYKNLIEKWEETCAQQKTPFHQTRQNGAYIIEE